MSISKLSKPGRWTEIASSTPSSGSTVTFSSIPAYDRLRLTSKDLRITAGVLWIRLNGDTGSNYVTFADDGGWTSSYVTTRFVLGEASQYSSDIYIDYANQATYKTLRGFGGEYIDGFEKYGLWYDTSTITSMSIIVDGGNFDAPAGEFKLFGAND